MLGAVFGKVIELSGFSKSIVSAVIGLLGRERAMLSIVLVCAILTYGGVSLFVVVFAVYPFAAEMFRQSDIPKRLIPCTIALGAFSFTMDALPGTPQIQNIIPTTFFKTTTWAAPWLGLIGSRVRPRRRPRLYRAAPRAPRRRAARATAPSCVNEPEPFEDEKLPNPWIALSPLVVVGVANFVLTQVIPRAYGATHEIKLGGQPIVTKIAGVAAIWAVEGALLLGILHRVRCSPGGRWSPGSRTAARPPSPARCWPSMNTASEYGFGGVIALLPGFVLVADALRAIPNPLVNEADHASPCWPASPGRPPAA